ncbi:hypothetical protein CsSME_00002570 [Camellia sinensis var. sinensis]
MEIEDSVKWKGDPIGGLKHPDLVELCETIKLIGCEDVWRVGAKVPGEQQQYGRWCGDQGAFAWATAVALDMEFGPRFDYGGFGEHGGVDSLVTNCSGVVQCCEE